MTQEKMTMHQLEQNLIDELNSNKKEIRSECKYSYVFRLEKAVLIRGK